MFVIMMMMMMMQWWCRHTLSLVSRIALYLFDTVVCSGVRQISDSQVTERHVWTVRCLSARSISVIIVIITSITLAPGDDCFVAENMNAVWIACSHRPNSLVHGWLHGLYGSHSVGRFIPDPVDNWQIILRKLIIDGLMQKSAEWPVNRIQSVAIMIHCFPLS